MNLITVVCPVCTSDNHLVLFRDHNRRDRIDCPGMYVKCRECSLVYLRERPTWGMIVEFYSILDPHITANAGQVDAKNLWPACNQAVPIWKKLLRKIRFRPHSWPLEALQSGSKRLLDIGCGNGAKLFEFVQRGYDIWGVDVRADAIRVCKKMLPQGHFIQAELQDTRFSDSYFDFIRIDNALEHVPNPREVIQECYRLLREGGQLLVYLPHGRSLSMRLMKGNSISSWIPFHLQLFTRKSLKRLMEETGFTDVKIYGYYPNSWLPLSIVQWKNQDQPTLTVGSPAWLSFVCYPLGWIASKVGLGEELVGVGKLFSKFSIMSK